MADIVLCFKIVLSLVALNRNDFFGLDPNRVTRGPNFKMINLKWDTKSRHNFFSVIIVSIWNALPECLVNSISLKQFKCGLQLINLAKYVRRDHDVFI